MEIIGAERVVEDFIKGVKEGELRGNYDAAEYLLDCINLFAKKGVNINDIFHKLYK